MSLFTHRRLHESLPFWLRRHSCVSFFFQAEDGIRDLTVTGVQTCALPILVARAHSRAADTRALLVPALSVAPFVLTLFWLASDRPLVQARPVTALVVTRSEERRVGKEGRSRGAPDP